MVLKPQDLLVAVRVALLRPKWTFQSLADAVGTSVSEAHQATKRAVQARLLAYHPEGVLSSIRANIIEFVVHGVKYAFPPDRGPSSRGIPTAHAAPALQKHFIESAGPLPVWPDPSGNTRGETFSPLYESAPIAAMRDPRMYEALALIDAIRGGQARERGVAEKLFRQLLEDQ